MTSREFYGDVVDVVADILEQSERPWMFGELSDQVAEVVANEGDDVQAAAEALPYLLAWNAVWSGEPCSVEQVREASFSLEEWEEGDEEDDDDDDDPRLLEVSLYSVQRALLGVVPEIEMDDVERLEHELGLAKERAGQPPKGDELGPWIQENLDGRAGALAQMVVERIGGQMKLADLDQRLRDMAARGLIEGYFSSKGGPLRLTERGEEFLNNRGGETERQIDLDEGLLAVLEALGKHSTATRKDLLSAWDRFARAHSSNARSESNLLQGIGDRLKNLADRGHVTPVNRTTWTITVEGRRYLEETAGLRRAQREADQLSEEAKARVAQAVQQLLSTMPRELFVCLMEGVLGELGFAQLEAPEGLQVGAPVFDAMFVGDDEESRPAKIMLVQSAHAPTAEAITAFSTQVGEQGLQVAGYLTTGDASADYRVPDMELPIETRLIAADELLDHISGIYQFYLFGEDPEQIIVGSAPVS